MKKTIKDFEKEQNKCLELVKSKNIDYSNKHFLYNFDDFGYKGIIVRIGDKFSRLRTFYGKEKAEVKDESVIDTLRDIANYAILCILKYEEDNQKTDDKNN